MPEARTFESTSTMYNKEPFVLRIIDVRRGGLRKCNKRIHSITIANYVRRPGGRFVRAYCDYIVIIFFKVTSRSFLVFFIHKRNKERLKNISLSKSRYEKYVTIFRWVLHEITSNNEKYYYFKKIRMLIKKI